MKEALLALLAAQSFSADGTYREHTGDYLFRQAHIRLEPMTDLFWNYNGEAEGLMGITLDYSNTLITNPSYRMEHDRVLVGLKNKLSSVHSYEVAVGFENFENESENTWKVLYERKLSDNLNASLSVERSFPVESYELKQNDAASLLSTSLKPSFQYQANEEQVLRFRGSWDSVEVGDEVTNLDLQWLYGLSRSENWLWAGVGANWITHSKNHNLFWSPSEFKSLGPRLEGSAPLFSTVSGFVSGSWHWLQEEDLDSGSGTYVSAGLQTAPRDKTHFQLSYEAINSKQGSSDWQSDGIYLKFKMPF